MSCGIKQPVNFLQRVHWHVEFWVGALRLELRTGEGDKELGLTGVGGHFASSGKLMEYLISPHRQPPEIDAGRGEAIFSLYERFVSSS